MGVCTVRAGVDRAPRADGAYDYRFLLRTQGSGGHVCAGAYIGKKGKVGE